jgi:PIN domain nuclease of toxin-antitoxin system
VILLLDAHALLWWLADDPTLDGAARRSIADPANDVLVSAASVWEIAIKRGLGTLEAPDDLLEAIDASSFSGLPVTLADGEAAGNLPGHHRDPFDRMLVAQAGLVGAVVVSRETSFRSYDVPVLPA